LKSKKKRIAICRGSGILKLYGNILNENRKKDRIVEALQLVVPGATITIAISLTAIILQSPVVGCNFKSKKTSLAATT
jgi:hypothetical protein